MQGYTLSFQYISKSWEGGSVQYYYYTIQRFTPVLTGRKSVPLHSFLPVLLGEIGVKLVWECPPIAICRVTNSYTY